MPSDKHIGVESSDFDCFFDKLGPAFKKEYETRKRKNIPSYKEEKFWELMILKDEGSDTPKYVTEDLFGNKDANDPLYFYKKWKNKTLNKDKKIPLRIEAIIKALLYLEDPKISFPDDFKVEGNEYNAALFLWEKFRKTLTQNTNRTNDNIEGENYSEEPKRERRKGNLVGTVPSKTDDFVGRATELKALYGILCDTKNIVFLHGIPGIGKTSLVKVFIERYKYRFDNIVWISINRAIENNSKINAGDSQTQLEQAFTRLYFDLTDDIVARDISMRFRYVINRLNNMDGNNLIVIDNLDQSILSYRDRLPHTSNWKILATGRAEVAGLKNVLLGSLLRKESKLLFKKFCSKNVEEGLLDLFLEEINRHTLMIEIAAKTLDESDTLTLEDLYEQLKKGELNDQELDYKIGTEYLPDEAKLITHLLYLFDKTALNQKEITILKTWYYLPPEPYTAEDVSNFTGMQFEHELLKSLLFNLSKKGWISFNKKSKIYSLNPLIQKSILYFLNPIASDVQLLAQYYSSILEAEETKISILLKIQYHCHFFIHKIGDDEDIPPFLIMLLHDQGMAYKRMEFYSQAIDCLEPSLILMEEMICDEHKIAFVFVKRYTATSLGLSYLSIGNYEAANKFYIKALDLGQESGEKDEVWEAFRIEIYKRLVEIYSLSGDKRAAEYLDRLERITDSQSDYKVKREFLEAKLKFLMIARDFEKAWPIGEQLLNQFAEEYKNGEMEPFYFALIVCNHANLLNGLKKFSDAIKYLEYAANLLNILAQNASSPSMYDDRLIKIRELISKTALHIGDMDIWRKNASPLWGLYCINNNHNKMMELAILLGIETEKPLPGYIMNMLRRSYVESLFIKKEDNYRNMYMEALVQIFGSDTEELKVFWDEVLAEVTKAHKKLRQAIDTYYSS